MQHRTNPWVAAASALLVAAADLGAQETGSATPRAPATLAPQARTDANSELAHAELVRKAGVGAIDVYFIGDSITRRWGALDYPDLLRAWASALQPILAERLGARAERDFAPPPTGNPAAR